jgi:hypothetical protein
MKILFLVVFFWVPAAVSAATNNMSQECQILAQSINLQYCAEQSKKPASQGWYNRQAWFRASKKAATLLSQSPDGDQAAFLQDIITVVSDDPDDMKFGMDIRATYDDYLKLL